MLSGGLFVARNDFMLATSLARCSSTKRSEDGGKLSASLSQFYNAIQQSSGLRTCYFRRIPYVLRLNVIRFQILEVCKENIE